MVALKAKRSVGHALPGADLLLEVTRMGVLVLCDAATRAVECEDRQTIFTAFAAGDLELIGAAWEGTAPLILWTCDGTIDVAALDEYLPAPEQIPTWTLRWFDGAQQRIGPCSGVEARGLALGYIAERWARIERAAADIGRVARAVDEETVGESEGAARPESEDAPVIEARPDEEWAGARAHVAVRP